MSRCENCKYWERDTKQKEMGKCRKAPPTVFPTQTKMGSVATMGFWPPTNEKDWCGDYEAKLSVSGTN